MILYFKLVLTVVTVIPMTFRSNDSSVVNIYSVIDECWYNGG